MEGEEKRKGALGPDVMGAPDQKGQRNTRLESATASPDVLENTL